MRGRLALALGAAACWVPGACAATDPDPAERWLTASRERATAACACEEDTDACVRREVGLPEERRCTLVAFRAVRRTLSPSFDCRAAAEAAATRCVQSSGCAGRDRCEAARLTALEDCAPEDSADARRFDHARFVCLGTPGCPTLSATGIGTPVVRGAIEATTSDDHEATCAGAGGRDVSIAWTATAAGSYRIDSVGSAYDTVLAIFDSCDAPFPRVCDDDDTGFAAEVFVAAEAGQTFLLIVDAFDGGEDSVGDWVLNVDVVE